MKNRLVPFAFLLVSLLCFGCAEEVLPMQEPQHEAIENAIEDGQSTDAEEKDRGEDPDEVLPGG